MLVGGLEKMSLIDFPGKVSCVLFLSMCNFRCPYCQNPDLVGGKETTPIELGVVYSFLERRNAFLDGVVISGGEPTLQPDLLSFCRVIREMGYAVKLDTNGSRPAVVRELIDKGVLDYIAMDVKTDPQRYRPVICEEDAAENVVTSIRLVIESGLPHEFRTTCVRPFVDQGTVRTISRHIEGAMLYVLQQFNPRTVLDPAFFDGTDRGVDAEEMTLLKGICEETGATCIVR